MLFVDNYTSETTSEAETEKFLNGLEYKDIQKSTFTAKKHNTTLYWIHPNVA